MITLGMTIFVLIPALLIRGGCSGDMDDDGPVVCALSAAASVWAAMVLSIGGLIEVFLNPCFMGQLDGAVGLTIGWVCGRYIWYTISQA